MVDSRIEEKVCSIVVIPVPSLERFYVYEVRTGLRQVEVELLRLFL
jgi:hypothetical protein